MARALWNLTKTATRYGIAGGLVYVTTVEGLWGSADESIAFFSKVSKELPAAEAILPKDLLDQSKDVVDKVRVWSSANHTPLGEQWNSAVFTSFNFLTEVPHYVCDLSSKAVDSLSAAVKSA